MSNYAQEANWLSCYHICYCTKPSVLWDDVTVPSGDSKSLWEYSHFPLWLVLTACSQWLHRSCLITRPHLDNHRAICRNLYWAQRDQSPGCRVCGVQEQGWCSTKGSSAQPEVASGLVPSLTRVLILSTFKPVLSLSLNSVLPLPPNRLSLHLVCHWSVLVFLHQTDGGYQ